MNKTIPNVPSFLDFLRQRCALTLNGPAKEKRESYWGHDSLHRTWTLLADGRKIGTYMEVHRPEGELAIQRYDGRIPGYSFRVHAGRGPSEVRKSLCVSFHTDVYDKGYRGRMDGHTEIPFL